MKGYLKNICNVKLVISVKDTGAYFTFLKDSTNQYFTPRAKSQKTHQTRLRLPHKVANVSSLYLVETPIYKCRPLLKCQRNYFVRPKRIRTIDNGLAVPCL